MDVIAAKKWTCKWFLVRVVLRGQIGTNNSHHTLHVYDVISGARLLAYSWGEQGCEQLISWLKASLQPTRSNMVENSDGICG